MSDFEIIVDAITGEVTERKFTKKELEQQKKEIAELEERWQKVEAQKQLKIEAYKKLGLSDEEIAAIL